MPINFNEEIDRSKNHSTKWSEMGDIFTRDDLLPVWIGDMDLKCAPEIIKALEEKAAEGIYGYVYRPQSYFQAAIDWTKDKFNQDLPYDTLAHCSGVVPSMSFCIQLFTNPGDKVLIQSPVYYPFYMIIRGTGREVAESPLTWDAVNKKFVMDFEDFEEKCKDPKVTSFLLCSPHNPAFRVWTEQELSQMAEICLKYNVRIFADEIWRDFVLPGHRHTPISALSKDVENITITGFSPSKAFNLAGLQASYLVLPNKEEHEKYDNFLNYQFLTRNNAFSIVGTEVAYAKCGYWLEELLVHIKGNIDYLYSYVCDNIKEAEPVMPEVGYLFMVDCRKSGLTEKELISRLEDTGGLAVDHGHWFGKAGSGYARINLGCSRPVVEEIAKRLKKALT